MCLNEDDIKHTPRDDLTKRQKNLCNDELSLNRDIVCCVLAAFLSTNSKPVKCLEGIGVCGINGMLWEKHYKGDVSVTINGCLEDDINVIKKNVELNNMKVEVVNEDPCILLRKILYDFIFLNCKTTTSKYLDSLFANLKEDSIFVITTSEDPALYWQTAEIALRNYGGIIAKTSIHREVAVRLVIAEMARAAARYNKGLKVLCTIGFKPQQSFTIIGKVKNESIEANRSVGNIKKLAYCTLCENRQFLPNSYFIDKTSNEISCNCSKESEGKVTIGIGPLWAGEIFDVEYVETLIQHSKKLPCGGRVTGLMNIILEEARCVGKNESNSPPNKKSKNSPKHPHFYINTHRHSAKEFRLQKLKSIISLLQKSGYRASRTHFDSEGVRTDASISECINLLRKNSLKEKSSR